MGVSQKWYPQNEFWFSPHDEGKMRNFCTHGGGDERNHLHRFSWSQIAYLKGTGPGFNKTRFFFCSQDLTCPYRTTWWDPLRFWLYYIHSISSKITCTVLSIHSSIDWSQHRGSPSGCHSTLGNPCTKKPLNFIFSQKTLEFFKGLLPDSGRIWKKT